MVDFAAGGRPFLSDANGGITTRALGIGAVGPLVAG
jgi:hypothetical protein